MRPQLGQPARKNSVCREILPCACYINILSRVFYDLTLGTLMGMSCQVAWWCQILGAWIWVSTAHTGQSEASSITWVRKQHAQFRPVGYKAEVFGSHVLEAWYSTQEHCESLVTPCCDCCTHSILGIVQASSSASLSPSRLLINSLQVSC